MKSEMGVNKRKVMEKVKFLLKNIFFFYFSLKGIKFFLLLLCQYLTKGTLEIMSPITSFATDS